MPGKRWTAAVFLALTALGAMAAPLCAAGPGPAGEGRAPLSLAVHPYLSPSELIGRFTPLAVMLGRRTGREIRIEISSDYADHVSRIGQGRADIAYMGPASYVRAASVYGKFPLLAKQEINGKPYFTGVIIKRAGSPLGDLKGMKGGRFAFGDPGSTMSHLVPRYMLIEAGLMTGDYESEFLQNHDNVALGVLVGDFDAGAVKEETFHKYRGRGIEALAFTPEISEHLFIARRDLDPDTVRALRQTMLALAGEPGGMQALTSIKPEISGLVPVEDSDYDNLRAIIKRLEREGVTP